jgi:hypothetical protein
VTTGDWHSIALTQTVARSLIPKVDRLGVGRPTGPGTSLSAPENSWRRCLSSISMGEGIHDRFIKGVPQQLADHKAIPARPNRCRRPDADEHQHAEPSVQPNASAAIRERKAESRLRRSASPAEPLETGAFGLLRCPPYPIDSALSRPARFPIADLTFRLPSSP